MTAFGYGDVLPITPVGKVLAAITAIFSIGLIAMPNDSVTRESSEVAKAKKFIDMR